MKHAKKVLLALLLAAESVMAVDDPPQCVARCPIAIWLAPENKSQSQFWNIISSLSREYSSPNRRIPVFPPHATLCTGYIEYASTNDLSEKLEILRQIVDDYCETNKRITLHMADPIPWFGKVWSQSCCVRFDKEGWPRQGLDPKAATETFKVISGVGLSWEKRPGGITVRTNLIPHISLMYCREDHLVDADLMDLQPVIEDRLKGLRMPSHIRFDTVLVVTPGLSYDWSSIVNTTNPPQQWQVIYARRFGLAPRPGPLRAVNTGGQTGPDTAGIQEAWSSGLTFGRWAPTNGQNEAGNIPAEFLLRRTVRDTSADAESIPRSQRTRLNVRDSQAVLILRFGVRGIGGDGGTRYTQFCATNTGKQCLVCDPRDKSKIPTVCEWIQSNGFETINVAGPRESTQPGIEEAARLFLHEIFARVRTAKINLDRVTGAVAPQAPED